MIRGVSFSIIQETTHTLLKIFGCIDVKKYLWYYVEDQSEIWTGPQGDEFFKEDLYDGTSFLSHIKNSHYIVFLKLQAYAGTIKCTDIHTYDEFEKSDCQLLILIYDCEYVEIFSKDAKISKILYENALVCGYVDVQYITDNNDKRTKLDIL